MEEAYQIALKHSTERGSKDQLRHNSKPLLTKLVPGDRVLVKNLSVRGGTGKLRGYCEDDIAVVVESCGDDAVVYKIRSGNVLKGKVRTLHRNML